MLRIEHWMLIILRGCPSCAQGMVDKWSGKLTFQLTHVLSKQLWKAPVQYRQKMCKDRVSSPKVARRRAIFIRKVFILGKVTPWSRHDNFLLLAMVKAMAESNRLWRRFCFARSLFRRRGQGEWTSHSPCPLQSSSISVYSRRAWHSTRKNLLLRCGKFYHL